jgi:hypothetical protein
VRLIPLASQALISGFLRIRLKCDFYVFINRVDFEFPMPSQSGGQL